MYTYACENDKAENANEVDKLNKNTLGVENYETNWNHWKQVSAIKNQLRTKS